MVVITAIDYAKAFNRLSFQHCLRAFARKGACTEIIRVLASFLSNRTMTVRVNNTWSEPLPVHGGVPQGSILGVLLFNVSTDDLEEEDDGMTQFVHSDETESSSTGPDTPLESSGVAAGRSGLDSDPWGDRALLSASSTSSSSSNGCLMNPATPSDHSSPNDTPWSSPATSTRGATPPERPRLAGLNPHAKTFVPRMVFPSESFEASAPPVNITDDLLQRLDEPLTPDSIYSKEIPLPSYVPSAEVLSITDELLADLRKGRDPSQDEAEVVATRIETSGGGRHDDPVARDVGFDLSTTAAVGFSSSTPAGRPRGRPRFRHSPIRSSGPRLSVRDWSFMPGRRNRRRRRTLKKKIIEYSDEGEVEVPPEVNKKRTGLRWKRRPVRTFKFVDDGMMLSKANMDSAAQVVLGGGRPEKDKHDLPSQNLFRRVVSKAESRGMVVNRGKTRLLCVSDSQTYKAKAHIVDSEGSRLDSWDKLKVLGFHMDSRPSVHAHIQALRLRMRDTVWILRHLKIAGFAEAELAVVYRTVIRPILDYCAVVYHPMMTDEQDQIVERLQAQALKSIYGYRDSYATMREKAGVTTHRARRIEMCDKFAQKAAQNPRFEAWFPRRTGRSGRHGEEFQEMQARTDRLFNSPLFYYRRRLNGKPGKIYGQRNRRYRE